MDLTKTIKVQARIHAPVAIVWELYTTPAHIRQWNNASDDWHTPRAESDFKPGGQFCYRMEARNGSFGFDFSGTFNQIKVNELIDYSIGDGRQVIVAFTDKKHQTDIEIQFEAESTHSLELQRSGWQAILNNFKKYVEDKHPVNL